MSAPELHLDPAYAVGRPLVPRPIVVLGAGGIVQDAHLPAYVAAGFPVVAIVDRIVDRAAALASRYGVPAVHASVEEAVAAAPADAVYDVALPPEHHVTALEALPDGAAALIQKPIGNHWPETLATLAVCRRKGLVAAVNTQLRFAPYIAEARRAIAAGRIGELVDLEVQVEVETPWERFPYVLGLDRLELNMHSVHYLDLVRSFLGDPSGVSCLTVRHPRKTHANSRSVIALHYGDRPVRALVTANHDHRFGPRHEQSSVKWEGTDGAIVARMGVLMDYPHGREDALEIVRDAEPEAGWTPMPFEGTWFPDAFAGSMGALLRHLEGSVPTLPTSIEDVVRTMALVEAGYRANAGGGTPPPYDDLTPR